MTSRSLRVGEVTFIRICTLTSAQEELGRLAVAKALHAGATWTWAQTLEHRAQSIEYSMGGFSESKSKLFQATVGPAALRVFSWRGRMTHDLAEPIPGAPALAVGSNAEAALTRLRDSIAAFKNWSKPLQPLFAYGALGICPRNASHTSRGLARSADIKHRIELTAQVNSNIRLCFHSVPGRVGLGKSRFFLVYPGTIRADRRAGAFRS